MNKKEFNKAFNLNDIKKLLSISKKALKSDLFEESCFLDNIDLDIPEALILYKKIKEVL